jgi:protein-S-isoprenylcysteine O-methyltransferase Ste14
MLSYVILIAGWIVYFAMHSLLAVPSFKKRFHPTRFRLFYSFFSLTGLLVLLFWNGQIQSEPFIASKGPVRYLSLMLTTFGVMIIQVTFRQYSLKGFVGLAEESTELKTGGILQHIRHPIYSGTILVTLGFLLFIPNLPTLISCSCIFVYLPIGMHLEEKKLEAFYGDAYRTYKKRVPSLIPRLI